MKNYNVILLILASVFICSTCSDSFLDKSTEGNIGQEALISEEGVTMLTTAAYANMTENNWGASIMNWTFGGMYGGDANKGSDPGDQNILNEMELYQTSTTNGYIADKWNWVYAGVGRCNEVLKIIPQVDGLNESVGNTRAAEVRFLRALHYYEGIKVFGVFIPWIDETITEPNPKVHNNIDITEKVIADLDFAATNLPAIPDLPGRANSWAAKTLKAYLLMQVGRNGEALPILEDVVNNGVNSKGDAYGLMDNINDNFSVATENNKEAVFSIQFSVDAPDNSNSGISLAYPHNSGPGGCCGFYQPSFELANSFQVDVDGLPYLDDAYRDFKSVTEWGGDLSINNYAIAVDPRLDIAIGRYDIPYKDWGLPNSNWVRNPSNGGCFFPKKHVFSKAEQENGYKGLPLGWSPGSALNYEYMRVADVYLRYAECLAEAGKLSNAMEYVNRVRARAANTVNFVTREDGSYAANYQIEIYPNGHEAFSNKETCVKAIRFERKLELAMEGHRWFDLARWGGDYMSQELSEYVKYESDFIAKFSTAQTLSPNRTNFPLPQAQIDILGKDENGEAYLKQNEAWN
ncbi:MAG: RagB/SusD family nutrient uptake outer membrane protein [Bacteroidales bacterium]